MGVSELAIVGNIGGTNMRLAVASEQGIIYNESVDPPLDADLFFRTIGNTATRFMDKYPGIKQAALAFCGPVKENSNGTTVGPFENIPSLGYEPFDINERIAAECKELKGFDFTVLNDAEAETHAAPSFIEKDTRDEVVTYIGLGTGVGGDSIKNGLVFSRVLGILAEHGHVPIKTADGSWSTLENRVSGTAITKLYGDGKKSCKEIALDPYNQKEWDRVGKDLAQGIAYLAPVFGTKHVVIGGGVSRDNHRFDEALRSELTKASGATPKHIVDQPPSIHYVPRDMIENAGLLGAYIALKNYI